MNQQTLILAAGPRPSGATVNWKKEAREWLLALLIAVPLSLVLHHGAFAQTSDELGGGVCKLVNMLTGKWLFGIAVLSLLGGGAALLFGGEMTDALKLLAKVFTIIGMILGATGLLTFAFAKFSGMSC